MPTNLNHLKSFLKDDAPGLITTYGTPALPVTGDTDWSGVDATQAAVDEGFNLTDGQILMGKTGTSALSNPSVAPTITAGTGGTLAAGTYEVGYTYVNAYGETTISPVSSITFASGTTNLINVAALTLPAGVTSFNWYLSDAPGSITLRLKTNTFGGAFTLTSVPVTSLPIPPGSNTTASSNHPVKGTITGSNGIGVTNLPGSIALALNNTGDFTTTAGVSTVTAVQHVPFSTTGPTNGQTPVYNSSSGQAEWGDVVATSPATTTAKGIGKVSVGPVDPDNPIFVGDNDPRLASSSGFVCGMFLFNESIEVPGDWTDTTIIFPSLGMQVGGLDWSTTPGKIYIPAGAGGHYHIKTSVGWDDTTGGHRIVWVDTNSLYKIGHIQAFEPQPYDEVNGPWITDSVSGLMELAEGQWLAVKVFTDLPAGTTAHVMIGELYIHKID